jgi:hypothetical protein
MALLSTDTYAVRQVTFNGYGISGHQWLSEDGKYTFIALESVDTGRPGGIGWSTTQPGPSSRSGRTRVARGRTASSTSRKCCGSSNRPGRARALSPAPR